ITVVEPDADRWLDALTRGSLLHDLYAAILREVRERGGGVDAGRDAARLRQLGDARLVALRALVPPPSEHVFERERAEIIHDLDLFVRFELGAARTPVGLEVGFGTGDAQGEPLARAEPVLVDVAGARFRIRGRIDRVDRLQDGSYEVTD